MEYQVKRGGKVVFQDIAKPSTMEWGSALETMEAALDLEKTVNTKALFPKLIKFVLRYIKVSWTFTRWPQT